MLPQARYQYKGVDHELLQDSLVAPCTFSARWVRSRVDFDPSKSDIVNGNFDSKTFSDLGNLITNANGSSGPNSGITFGDVINVDVGWAGYVNPVSEEYHWTTNGSTLISDSTLPNATFVESFFEQSVAAVSDDSVSFVVHSFERESFEIQTIRPFTAKVLGFVMTDALSRYAAYLLYDDQNFTFPSYFTGGQNDSWNFDLWRRGYSYGIRDPITRLSLGVLVTHMLMALIFVVCLLFAGWTSSSWASIGELIAIPLRSRDAVPNQFQGTDAGIDISETWAQNVRIREVGSDRLEMSFDVNVENEKSGLVDRVKVGRKYG